MIDPNELALSTERSGWVQVECESCAPEMWERLDAALRVWRFEHFNFVRKPPGLRLRLCGAELRRPLQAWVDECQEEGILRSYRISEYEPEIHRFGGPDGMAIAHRLFTRDSVLLVRWESLGVVSRRELSLALVSDLAARCLDDGAEVWDVWMRVRQALGSTAPVHPSAHERDAAQMDPAWLDTLTAAEVELCRRWVEAHDVTAGELRAAELTVGRRSWVASACVFHWNRAGLDARDIARIAGALASMWVPAEHVT